MVPVGNSGDTLTQLKPVYKQSADAAPGVVGALAWPLLSGAGYLFGVWWLVSVFGLAGLLLVRSRDPLRRTGATTPPTAAWCSGR